MNTFNIIKFTFRLNKVYEDYYFLCRQNNVLQIMSKEQLVENIFKGKIKKEPRLC